MIKLGFLILRKFLKVRKELGFRVVESEFVWVIWGFVNSKVLEEVDVFLIRYKIVFLVISIIF